MGIEDSLIDLEECAKHDIDLAIVRINTLAELYPSDDRVVKLAAYFYSCTGDLSSAISFLTLALDLKFSFESLFDRARHRTQMKMYSEAIEDCGVGIRMCNEHCENYYKETFFFIRAYCYVKSNYFELARSDLDKIVELDEFWLDGSLQKKIQLQATTLM